MGGVLDENMIRGENVIEVGMRELRKRLIDVWYRLKKGRLGIGEGRMELEGRGERGCG